MAEEKILDRVAKLLERANHKGTGAEERDVCLKKADELMMRHQIDEAMLAGRTGDKPSEPVMAEMHAPSDNDEFFPVLGKVVGAFQTLCKVRVVFSKTRDPEDAMKTTPVLKVVGFPDDVSYFQMLWTGAYLVFSSKLYPRWDNTHTLAWNVKAQKEAGTKWGVIYDLAVANGWSGYRRGGRIDPLCPVVDPDIETVEGRQPVGRCPADKGYFKRLYQEQCKLEGVDSTNHTQRNAAYRESYAYGFLDEISTRILQMMDIRNQHVSKTIGAELALRDRSLTVQEWFLKMFPNSQSMDLSGRKYGTETAGSLAGHEAGRNVDLLAGRSRMGGTKAAIQS